MRKSGKISYTGEPIRGAQIILSAWHSRSPQQIKTGMHNGGSARVLSDLPHHSV